MPPRRRSQSQPLRWPRSTLVLDPAFYASTTSDPSRKCVITALRKRRWYGNICNAHRRHRTEPTPIGSGHPLAETDSLPQCSQRNERPIQSASHPGIATSASCFCPTRQNRIPTTMGTTPPGAMVMYLISAKNARLGDRTSIPNPPCQPNGLVRTVVIRNESLLST